MKQSATQLAIIFVSAWLILFANLGTARLWDRDEPRNAGCAREMLNRGDWVTPVFNGELRQAKPAMLYWLIMSAYAMWGENEFAARFWSAVCGLGTVFATYLMGCRLFRNQTVATWGAVILSSTIMFDVASRAATPDAPLIFFVTAALTLFVYGRFPAEELSGPIVTGRVSLWRTVGINAILGLAVLTKGPVGLVLPTAVMGMFLLMVRLPEVPPSAAVTWSERMLATIRGVLRPFLPRHFLATCWEMRPLTAIVACACVALPWYLWVGIRTDGEWLRAFFLEENLGRAMQPLENHRGSVFYYPLAVCVGFFPWSVLMAPIALDTVGGLRRRDPDTGELIFLASWVGVYLGIFSIAQTKLPSYVTPMYPALALFAGRFVSRWSTDLLSVPRWWLSLAASVYALIGIVFLVALPIVARRFLPGEEWLAAIGLIPLAGGAAMLFWSQYPRRAAVAMGCSAVLFCAVLFAAGTVRVDRHQRSHELLAMVNARSVAPQIASFGCLEPSWVFYVNNPIIELTRPYRPIDRRTSTTATGSAHPVREFLSGSEDAFLIITDRNWEAIQDQVPSNCEILARIPYFLKKEQLLLVGHNGSAVARRPDSPHTR